VNETPYRPVGLLVCVVVCFLLCVCVRLVVPCFLSLYVSVVDCLLCLRVFSVSGLYLCICVRVRVWCALRGCACLFCAAFM